MIKKFNIGDKVYIPYTFILGNGRKFGIVLDVIYDDWNEIYKYKVKMEINLNNMGHKYISEWFMEEELKEAVI